MDEALSAWHRRLSNGLAQEWTVGIGHFHVGVKSERGAIFTGIMAAVSMKAQSVHNAAARGDIPTMQELIVDKQVLQARTAAGWSLLHTISQHDHDKVAGVFVGEKELDPNAEGDLKETPLHVCAIYGSPKVCAWLLSHERETGRFHPADPVHKDMNQWTPIHYAARFGHQEVLEMLRKEHRERSEHDARLEEDRRALERKRASASRNSMRNSMAPPAAPDQSIFRYKDPVTGDGWTPLHVAARFEQVDIITYLLTSAADKEAKDHQGWTALHVAVRHGLTNVVSHLLNHRLDVDARTNLHESAGHIALKYGHGSLLDMLVNNGMNIETRDEQGETMLHYAARQPGAHLIEKLANRGALLQAKNVDGWCALHVAADLGNLEAIQALISHGCDIDIRDNEGGSWLFLLDKAHYSQVTKFLVSANARSGLMLNGPRMVLKGTSLVYTQEAEEPSKNLSCERHFAMIKFVSQIASGDDFDPSLKEAQELLHYACEYGHTELISFLVHQGTDIYTHDPDGMNAMHIAAKFEKNDVIRLLLSNGMELNIKDEMNWTPLHHACCAGKDKTVEFLLDNKADVNAANHNGEVPLHLAFGNGHMEIIRLLLQADPPADRNVEDKIGFTPVQYATIELAERMGNAGWDTSDIEAAASNAGEESGQGQEAPNRRCVVS